MIILIIGIVLVGAIWLFSKSKINYLVTETQERLTTEKGEYFSI